MTPPFRVPKTSHLCPVPKCNTTRLERKKIMVHLRRDHHINLDRTKGGNLLQQRARHARQFGRWLRAKGYGEEGVEWFTGVEDGLGRLEDRRQRGKEGEAVESVMKEEEGEDDEEEATGTGGAGAMAAAEKRRKELLRSDWEDRTRIYFEDFSERKSSGNEAATLEAANALVLLSAVEGPDEKDPYEYRLELEEEKRRVLDMRRALAEVPEGTRSDINISAVAKRMLHEGHPAVLKFDRFCQKELRACGGGGANGADLISFVCDIALIWAKHFCAPGKTRFLAFLEVMIKEKVKACDGPH